MYKVFNDSQRIVIDRSDSTSDFGDAITICIRNLDKLPEIVESHVFNNNTLDLVLLGDKPEELISAFEKIFTVKLAAGAWVFNSEGKLLMIKRNGLWDIPKGHLEKGESIEECALRETMEETGVKKLKSVEFLGISRHIYFLKQKPVLKESHWYLMTSSYKGDLKPQKKEGITKVKWMKSSKIESKLAKGWNSLYEFYKDRVESRLSHS